MNTVYSAHPRSLLSSLGHPQAAKCYIAVVMTARVWSQLLQKSCCIDVTVASTVILLMSLSTLDGVGAELGGRNCVHKNTRGINFISIG